MQRERIGEVCRTVLKRIVPSEKQRREVEALAKRLERRVALAAKEFGVDAEVRLTGSVAKDTWLSEDPDIDVFMRVPRSIPRERLGEVCLEIARKATEGSKHVERFAEHPYLEAFVEGYRVNIVPCYKVERGEWLSATDRTPFHTDYVNERLKPELRDEVRLLKRFMKGIGVYGAEIKIGGFSGYLCELLTLFYGSFLRVLEAFAGLRRRLIVDIEGYYNGRMDELALLFKEPLVVVDPVDKGRNVASAVQKEKLYGFVAAARAFLKNPSVRFFYPSEIKPLGRGQLDQALKNRGSSLLFLVFGGVEAVPDVLWGQLYRSLRSLRRLLALHDFSVLRSVCWSDEESLNVFVFELAQKRIPLVKCHLGPPLEKSVECERFLRKHSGRPETVAGPYVEDGRWVVLVKRQYTDAVDLLRDKLKNGRSVGVAEKISRVFRDEGFRIFVNGEIADLYEKNRGFARFLTEFLSGKPRWLETVSG